MKICFEKDICSNLGLSLRKEWLEVNQFGSYSCSTIFGLNYRKYHGLFAVPNKSNNSHILLLSKFEESVFIGSQVHELSTNQYERGIHPKGFIYLQRFCVDPFPKFTYNICGRRLEKTLFMIHDKNVLVIRYTNKNQGTPLKLILKPIFACREINDLTHETQKMNTDSYHDEKVVKIAPKPDIPQLNIYYMKGEYTRAPLWYYNFQYSDKIELGPNSHGEKEDLFNTGFFSCILDTYESLDLYITVEDLHEFNYEELYQHAREYRKQVRNGFKNAPMLVKDIAKNTERQRIFDLAKKSYLFPDYPFTKMSTRNLILSLFGNILIEGNTKKITSTIKFLCGQLNDGLLPDNPNPGVEKKYCVDCSLLLIYFMLYYYNATRDRDLLENVLYEPGKEILDKLTDGTSYNIYRDKDGLLFSGTRTDEVSGFPALDGPDGVARYGKLLEVNALYYNALKTFEYFSREINKSRVIKKYADLAAVTRKSFLRHFWDEKNVQFSDVVRDDYRDNTFRINQIFLISLPFSVLDQSLGLNVLKQIETELLTPYGLRSLSYRDERYLGKLDRIIGPDDPEYYRGCVWPWSIRLYVASVLKYRGDHQQITDYLRKMLDNFDHVFYYDSIGSLPEIFEGDPPHRRNGAFSSSLSMNEFLLAYYYLNNK